MALERERMFGQKEQNETNERGGERERKRERAIYKRTTSSAHKIYIHLI